MNRSERLRARQIERQRPRRGGGDVGLQDQAFLRDDAGFKMTNAQYDQYLKEEGQVADFQGNIDKYGEGLTAAEKEIASVESKIKASSPENLWNKYKQTWKPVRVRHGFNIENTYTMPQELIDKLHTEMFNQGNGSFVGAYDEEGVYSVDVRPQGTSDAYGKELHEAIGGAGDQIYDVFMHGEKKAGTRGGYSEEQIEKMVAGTFTADGLGGMDWLKELNGEGKEPQRYKSQAQMIREKQAAAMNLVKKQRDIIGSKRSEMEGTQALMGLRDQKKKQLQDTHKKSVSHRKALFGG